MPRCVAQRSPLSKADLIAKQDQSPNGTRLLENLRPGLSEPYPASLLIKMTGDEARFLEREAQALEQVTHIMDVIQLAKLAQNHLLNRIPSPITQRNGQVGEREYRLVLQPQIERIE